MSIPVAALDYRSSHLRPGSDYDRTLAEDPFDAYLAAREAELVPRLVARLFPGGVPRYLDFACGTGRITQLIEPLARESWGVDVSAGMLEEARRRCPRTKFLQVDVTRDELAAGPFDLVTAFRFFGNAQAELRESALSTLSRLVTPGGYLVLNNHRNPADLRNLLLRAAGLSLPSVHGGSPVDLHHWALKRLMRGAGFRVVRRRGIGFWVARAAWMRPEVLNSRAGRCLECLSAFPPFGPFCPDTIYMARRLPGLVGD